MFDCEEVLKIQIKQRDVISMLVESYKKKQFCTSTTIF